jgi:hypothetical protein
MNADVDEGPKLSDVSDYSFENHASLDVGEFADGLGEIGGRRNGRVGHRRAYVALRGCLRW